MAEQQDHHRFDVPVSGAKRTLSVKEGEWWRFTANGDWNDGLQDCGPQGYRRFIPYILDLRPEVEDAPYGCAVGRFKGVPGSGFRIGLGTVRKFAKDGDVEFAANLRSKYAGQAKGKVRIIAERLDGEVPRGRGFLALWEIIRRTMDRTAGLAFIAILTLGVGAALALLPQGQDLVRTISETEGEMLWPKFWFGFSLFVLSMQAWFWSRVIINFNYGSDRDDWRPRWFLEWTPRVLGVAPGVFSLWAMTSSPEIAIGTALWIAAVSVAVFLWVVFRNDAWDRIKARRQTLGDKRPPRVGRLWVLVWLALAVVSFIALWISPVDLARGLGAPAVVYLGVSMLIPPVVIAIQTGAPIRFPALGLLVVWAVLLSFNFDNHRVGRRAGFGTQETAGPIQQYTLEDAYKLWRARAVADPDGSIPMVLVASEGGASRAGYWTSEVLAQLHERTGGQLADRVFAISSVSGGSVGAVAYAAALQDYRDDTRGKLGAQMRALAGDDALSPAVGSMLFGDLAQRFLPVGFPDRAEALERSWEVTWRRTCEASRTCRKDLISGPFLNLWPHDAARWTPLVIVNGASEETGRRVVTSKLALRADQVNVQDFYATTGRNIAASTAIHNGARFPYVSPAGTMVDTKGKAWGHIVDGGYFDPAGTEVVRELAHAIVHGPGAGDAKNLKFIFVYIGYGDSVMPPNLPKAKELKSSNFANELLAPLRGMIASRSGHAQHMARNVKADVAPGEADQVWQQYAPGLGAGAALRGSYVPILLCDNPRRPGEKEARKERKPFEMPMDWALSGEAKTRMGFAVDGCGANDTLMTILVEAVKAKPPPAT